MIAAWVFAVVAGFVLVVSRTPLDADEVALGPFAGAAAREWESDYVKLGLRFLPYVLACILAGVLVQLAVPTSTKAMRVGRFIVWAASVASWFLYALRTYGDALE